MSGSSSPGFQSLDDDGNIFGHGPDLYLDRFERRLDEAVEARDLLAVEEVCETLLDELQPV